MVAIALAKRAKAANVAGLEIAQIEFNFGAAPWPLAFLDEGVPRIPEVRCGRRMQPQETGPRRSATSACCPGCD